LKSTKFWELAMKQPSALEKEFWSKSGRAHGAKNQSLVPVYRVGELFRRGRITWPEGGVFTYSRGGLELTLFLSNIRDDIVHDVRQGEVELALIVELPLIVVTYRFGQSIPWDDVPYSWHLQPMGWRVIPTIKSSLETRALLWITLVGANDGLIHAQRGVTLSPQFTCSLYEAIRAQALMAFDPDDCTSAISKVFLDYPSTVDRLALAQARTLGNE
jgi:hypothetical protein